jgi:hypothetical protein
MRKNINENHNLLFKAVFKIIVIIMTIGLLIIPVVSCGGVNGEGAGSEVDTIPIVDGVINTKEYQEYSSMNAKYAVYWSTDGEFIYMGLKARTSGWVAIGFQPDSDNKKENVDFILGYVTAFSSKVFDMYSVNEEGPHPLDTELGGTDDILQFATGEADGYTIVEFKRQLDTGDIYDKLLTEGVHKVIWAYSVDDGLYAEHNNGAWGYSIIDIKTNA